MVSENSINTVRVKKICFFLSDLTTIDNIYDDIISYLNEFISIDCLHHCQYYHHLELTTI